MTTAAWVQPAAAEGRLPDDELRAAYASAWQESAPAAPAPAEPDWVEQAPARPAPEAKAQPQSAASAQVATAPAQAVEYFRIPYNPYAENPGPAPVVSAVRREIISAPTPVAAPRNIAPVAMAEEGRPLRNYTTPPVVVDRTPQFRQATLLPPPQSAFSNGSDAYAQLSPAAGEVASTPAAKQAAADPLLSLPGAATPPPLPAPMAPPALVQDMAPTPGPNGPTNATDITREALKKAKETKAAQASASAAGSVATPGIPALPAPPAMGESMPSAPAAAAVQTPATPAPVAPAMNAAPPVLAETPAPAVEAATTATVPAPAVPEVAAPPVIVASAEAPAASAPVPVDVAKPVEAPKPKPVVKVSPNERFKPKSATTDAVMDSQKRRLTAEAHDKEAGAPISLDRSREGDARLQSDEGVKKHTGVGVSISVRKPQLNADYELNEAYQASASGDTIGAIAIYQRVLDAEPKNTDALFGLATMYHRIGRLEKAKPLYLSLLAINPGHRDGLNNFLMLLGEENPQEALQRMQSLEQANPDYAPIPAQMAMVYQRQGNLQAAVDAMTRATAKDRDNLQYRYNLAVLLDQAGNWNDAASIYKEVLAAVDRGERVPATRDNIQQRLTYLMSRHA